MKKLSSISIVIIALTILACSKNADVVNDLKVATKSNSGVSATINEKEWKVISDVPKDSIVSSDLTKDSLVVSESESFYASFGADTTSLKIFANGRYEGYADASFAQILLYVRNFNGNGTYPLSTNDSASVGAFTVIRPTGVFEQYFTGGANTGFVTITSFNRDSSLASGEFAFSAASIDTNVVIKNGKFAAVPFNFNSK